MQIMKWTLLAFLGCLIIYLFLINLLCPIIGEDYVLTAIHPHEEITSINDFFSKMFSRVIRQARSWNARIGELTSIIFSCFPKIVFDVFNTIVTIGIVHLMYRYAYKKDIDNHDNRYIIGTINKETCVDEEVEGGGNKGIAHQLIFYIISIVLIILFLPKLGEILFWRTGSTNYWWSAGLLLLAGLPLREYIGSTRLNNLEDSHTKIFLFAILNFAAGFTNENSVCVFIFLYFITIVYDIIKYKREHLWVIINFIYMSLGWLILLTCKSTKHRIEYYNSVFNVHGTFFQNIIDRIPNVIGTYFSTNYIYIILLLLTVTIFITTVLINFRHELTIKFLREIYRRVDVFVFYIVSLIAAVALVGSPYIEERSYILCNIFSIICICYYSDLAAQNMRLMTNNLRKLKIICLPFLIILFLGFCYKCLYIFNIYYEYHIFVESRNLRMENAHENGYRTEWSVYDFKNNRELNTREGYISPKHNVIENYYGVKLK